MTNKIVHPSRGLGVCDFRDVTYRDWVTLVIREDSNVILSSRHRTFATLILVIAVCMAGWVGYSAIRFGYERLLLQRSGDFVTVIHNEDSVVWHKGPLDVVARYEWLGPRILERPMRAMGIPIFDRITTVFIHEDFEFTESHINAIASLPNVRLLIIDKNFPKDQRAQLRYSLDPSVDYREW